MHKNKLVKILISSITLFVLCMCCNITPANAIGNHVISNNSFFGVGKLPYKSKSHPVTHKQLNKKLNRTIYLIKHKKNKSLLNNNHFKINTTLISLGGVNFNITIYIFIGIMLLTVALIYKNNKRRLKKVMDLWLRKLIQFTKLNLRDISSINKYLLFVRLICYLNKWSKYCLHNVNLKSLYKNIGHNNVYHLFVLVKYLNRTKFHCDIKYINCLCHKFDKYKEVNTNHECDYVYYVLLNQFKYIYAVTNKKKVNGLKNKREMNIALGNMCAYDDLYINGDKSKIKVIKRSIKAILMKLKLNKNKKSK